MRPIYSRLLIAAALSCPAAAQAEEWVNVTLVNNSESAIAAVHFSPPEYEDWAANALDGGPIAPGATGAIRFNAFDTCSWNMRVTYLNGETAMRTELNLCTDPTITLD